MTSTPIMDDDPITLQEACEIVFRGTVSVATLRSEAARGHLDIFRVGRQYFTTINSVREFIRLGRDSNATPKITAVQNVSFDLLPESDVTSLHESLRERLGMLKPVN